MRPPTSACPAIGKLAIAALFASAFAACAHAGYLITGGEGNTPLADPGWPKGASEIFNTKSRIAWWEGPPFGGGQWHAECRGDAKALNEVLVQFEKLDVKTKRIVVHDGVGHSFWLNMNREKDKNKASEMDWMFMVWQPANWERLSKMPTQLNPTSPEDAKTGPPSQIDIYTGGKIRWADVVVPKGITLVDNRLEAHGFKVADGVVFEGTINDNATKKPIAGAVARLERIEPQKTGGYKYVEVAKAPTAPDGRWSMKKVPDGWHRVVIEAEGFTPRVAGYAQTTGEPGWTSYAANLGKTSSIEGIVTDDDGEPLADVVVQIDGVNIGDGRYVMVTETSEITTGKDGRFRSTGYPAGTATIWLRKEGYCRPGLGRPVTLPATGIDMGMKKAASAEVTVDFGDAKPSAGYLVQIEPDGGSVVGSFGGSAQLDPKGIARFSGVPPGRYTIQGKPNPSNGKDHSNKVEVDLKGGETTKVKLLAY